MLKNLQKVAELEKHLNLASTKLQKVIMNLIPWLIKDLTPPMKQSASSQSGPKKTASAKRRSKSLRPKSSKSATPKAKRSKQTSKRK